MNSFFSSVALHHEGHGFEELSRFHQSSKALVLNILRLKGRNGLWYRAGGVVRPIKEGWCVLICHGAVKFALAAQVVATTAVSVVQVVVQFMVFSVWQLQAAIQVTGDMAYRKTCPRGQ